jgi:thiamine-monophosphate kinase
VAARGRAQVGSAEDRLIARHFRPLATHPGAFGLIDDAAAISLPPRSDLVLTTDAIVGGVHFFPDDPPDLVAKKALRVNLSDIAAKGSQPVGFLLTLAMPAAIDDAWLKPFARGLGVDAKAYGCPLLGGDSVRTPGPLTISITIFGSLRKGTMVPRTGAKAGDRVCVTGTIGDAALGLRLRQDDGAAARWALAPRERDHLARRYLLPQPRNAAAEALRTHASAAMDVSDGLAGDLGKLCAASGVSARLAVGRIPLSKAARRVVAAEPDLLMAALSGGDDYEVACTVPARKLASFQAAMAAAGVPVAEIGEIVGGGVPPQFLGGDGQPLLFKSRSFSHF